MLLLHRTALRRRCVSSSLASATCTSKARLHASPRILKQSPQEQAQEAKKDPRLSNISTDLIEDEFAVLKSTYQAPKHPIILAHGLLGFDELRLGGANLPGIEYWYGITQALAAKGVEVITSAVPPSGRIEDRAGKLAEAIEGRAGGKAVNIIAGIIDENRQHHAILTSSSGLDSRYMISRLQPSNVKVLSLTTIATPHRGSSFADYLFAQIGMTNIPKIYKAMESFGLETGAFSQLTREYMASSFNPRTPDVEGIKYYSYGAQFEPHLLSVFRKSHDVIAKVEGPNDGMVSVESSRWGEYKGTLNHVSHLDLINWSNRLRWYFWELTGKRKKNFNAIAFYLSIADMLAKEGL